MLIPAWHIGVLALLYAAEYFWRAYKLPDRQYMYIGKAFGRLILGAVYVWFTILPYAAEVRAQWVRWALLMFLIIDLVFVVVDHAMRWKSSNAKHP